MSSTSTGCWWVLLQPAGSREAYRFVTLFFTQKVLNDAPARWRGRYSRPRRRRKRSAPRGRDAPSLPTNNSKKQRQPSEMLHQLGSALREEQGEGGRRQASRNTLRQAHGRDSQGDVPVGAAGGGDTGVGVKARQAGLQGPGGGRGGDAELLLQPGLSECGGHHCGQHLEDVRHRPQGSYDRHRDMRIDAPAAQRATDGRLTSSFFRRNRSGRPRSTRPRRSKIERW